MRLILWYDLLFMLFDCTSGQVNSETNSDGRKNGRLPQDSLVSSLGPVIDLSVTGARILTRQNIKRIGQELEVTVTDNTAGLKLKAKVIWVKKIGWFRREVGMAFLEMNETDRQVLTKLATNNRNRRVIPS